MDSLTDSAAAAAAADDDDDGINGIVADCSGIPVSGKNSSRIYASIQKINIWGNSTYYKCFLGLLIL